MSLIERKRLFVNSLAQGRLLMRFAGYWVVYHIVLWHTLFMFRFFQYRFDLMMGAAPQTFMELYGSFCVQYYPIVLSAIGVLPILLWDMVKMTHRIVGPLIRFQRALESLQRGERVEKVTLRDRDLLIEYESAFNKFLVHYNQLLDQQATRAQVSQHNIPEDELLSQVQELSRSVSGSSSCEVPVQ